MRLKAQYSEAELVELVTAVCVFNFMNRFNRVMDPDIDKDLPPVELFEVHADPSGG